MGGRWGRIRPGAAPEIAAPAGAARGPGDKGRAGRAGHGGGRDRGKEGKEALPAAPAMDRECWKGSAHTARPARTSGGDKVTKGTPGGRGASSPRGAQSSAAPNARRAPERFPLAAVGLGFFRPEVSRRFTLTTKGRDFIHQLESEVSGKGDEGDFYGDGFV